MRKILLVINLLLCFISKGQVYQSMPQWGYGPVKRFDIDSSLTIPTTCGIPTLRTTLTKKSAIAFDSCNNKFYKYNPKTAIWSEVSGGGTTPNLQQVTDIGNTTTNDISIHTLNLRSTQFGDMNLSQTDDDGSFLVKDKNDNQLLRATPDFTTGIISLKIGEPTTAGGTFTFINTPYANGIFTLPNASGTLALTSDITSIDTTSLSNRINLKVNISDTNTMLSPYLKKTDTTNKWVNNIYRKSGKDSIFYQIGSTEYKIKDSVGSGNGRFGNDTATIVMAKVHNDAGIQLTNGMVVRWSSSGTNADVPSVRLANNKGDSSSANTLGFVTGTIAINDTGWVILSGKIEKLNTSAFSNGDIIYLDSISGQWTKTKPVAPYHMVYLGVVIKANNGNGSIFVKAQNGYELDEIHDCLISGKLNNQVLVYSDTQKVWKNRNIYSIVDTTSLSNRINLKLNSSDSSTYYTKYRSDTSRTNIYSAINNKGYAIPIGLSVTNILASTTYYFGMTTAGFQTLSATRRVYIPVSGTIKACQLYLRCTTGSSGENWTMSIRLNNSSNTTISSVATTSSDKLWSNLSLNISVNAGDYIEITTTTPAWTSAVGNTQGYGTIFIQ